MNPLRVLAVVALPALVTACASASAPVRAVPSEPASAARQPAPPSEPTSDRVVISRQAIDDLQSAYKSAIAAAGPAVVSVYSSKVVGEGGVMGNLFGGDGGLRRGVGSGFILDADGFILTNNHVVEDAAAIRVELADGREFDAEVIGTDPPTDLALVRIDGKDLSSVEIGDSDVVEVGDFVLAIGNPFGLPQTVSSGIVSGKGRANVGIVDYEDFIQTDAPINPGNSGGPLIDLRGRVIGINTAIASRSGGNNGIAFAIPVNMAMDIAGKLRDQGRVARGQLGVVISDLDPEEAERLGWKGKGVLIRKAPEGGPAHGAGLQGGDIITRLNGAAVSEMPAFRSDIAAAAPGSKVRLRIWREGIERDFEVTLGELASRRR